MSLIQLTETTSTNTWLKQHRKELCHGAAVTALRQTEGRGRMGHTWLDSEGMLPISVLLRNIPHPETITLAVGAAVCSVLEDIINEPVMIKWPNDIILRGHKLCGILCESVAGGYGLDIICGVGVNIGQPSEYFDASGIPHGGSIKSLLGVETDRNSLASALRERITLYSAKAFEEIYSEYKAHCITLGRQVRIIKNSAEQVAYADDVAINGHLVCHDENGGFEVNSGEVSVRGLLDYI